MNRTLAQRRAAFALERIKERSLKGNYGNYVSYVDALPAAIHRNGLGQAVAMELAAVEDPGHRDLGRDLRDWLCGSDEAAPYRDFPNANDDKVALLRAITQNDQARYLRAQSEALALLVWLKKIARALLEPDQGQS
jgi:CRISPR-associated protein Cmr5